MERELIQLTGTVDAVVFRNDDNGYAVLRVRTASGDIVTAVGCIPRVGVGENLVATGTWGAHPTYGDQFCIETVERSLPAAEGAILDYLSSGAVKGIGPKTAEKLVDKFGADCFRIIENEPERLCEIQGITRARAERISEDFLMQNGVSRLMEFLTSNGLEPALALRLYRVYGNAALKLLQNNPYLLTNLEFGVEFSKADSLAMRLGLAGEASERVEAAVLYELSYNADNGHTFIPRDKLCLATCKLIGVDYDLVDQAVGTLRQDGLVVIEEVCGLNAVYLAHLYEAEVFVKDKLGEMLAAFPYARTDIEETISNIEKEQGIDYAPAQREAIRQAADNPVMILTGGPGTGKTTIIRAILALFEKQGLRVALAAPTGRAAKRMSESCGAQAKTIHRMLEMGYEEQGFPAFGRDHQNPLEIDVLVIDETSMVDLMLMRAVLDALRPECRLILVGDADQLPSVGAGNVLKDFINSGLIPTVRLTEIFRQAAESNIVVSAHAINRGEMPDLQRNDSDLFFLRRGKVNDCIDTIVELVKTRLPENMGIPASQIQVLTTNRRFEVGCTVLNRRLQEALNPKHPDKPEKRFGERVFRTGDRVMQVRNNYDLAWTNLECSETGTGVFNGDVGEIVRIDSRDEVLSVQFDDRIAHYSFAMLNELEHAYAMTVHKAQGSEFRAVVFAALGGTPYLLHRSVLYTAITRARELLVIVGSSATVQAMVDNNKQRNRFSGLRFRLSGE